MLRTTMLAAARSSAVRRLVEANPLTRTVVDRFVAGADTSAAIGVTVGSPRRACT